MMDKLYGARCITYEVSKLHKSKFSISLINIFLIKLVLLLESIFYSSRFCINLLIFIAIQRYLFDFSGKFYKILKLVKAYKCIILKIIYILYII